MNKKWYIYKNRKLSAVKSTYLELQKVGEKVAENNTSGLTLWKLVDLILTDCERRDLEQDWGLEKEYLGLYNEEAMNSLLDNFKKLSQTRKTNDAPSNLVEKWQALGLQKELVQNFEKPEEIIGQVVELTSSLALVAEAMGISTGLAVYNPEKLLKFFNGQLPDYSYLDLIKTCREVTFGEKEWSDVAKGALGFLDFYISNYDSELKEHHLLVISLLLRTIYERFNRFTLEERQFVLQNYFYQALILGLPVKQRMADSLKATKDLIWFARVSKEDLLFLSENKEIVAAFSEVGDDKKLAVLFADYKAFKKDENFISEYLNKIFGVLKPQEQQLTIWLNQALEIYIKLGNGTLIDWIKEHELDEVDKYRIDLTELVFLYGVGQVGWGIIYNYYQNAQEPFRVPFKALVGKLKEIIDLNKAKEAEDFLSFVDYFKSKKIIGFDEDLVVFNEEQGCLVWNN